VTDSTADDRSEANGGEEADEEGNADEAKGRDEADGADETESPYSTRVRAVGVVLLVATVAVGVAVLVSRGLELVLGMVGPVPAPILVGHALDTALVNAGVFGGVAGAYLRVRRRAGGGALLRVRRPTRRDLRLAVQGFFVVLAVGAVLHLAVGALGLPTGENTLTSRAEADPRLFVVAGATSLLFVGPGEELLFRGVVQGRLREAFGPATAVGLGGVVFAVPHLVAAYTGPGSLVSIGVVFGVSVALGTLYEVTDTLFVPAVAHGLYNVAILAIVAVGAG
jgi:hypothetical protein